MAKAKKGGDGRVPPPCPMSVVHFGLRAQPIGVPVPTGVPYRNQQITLRVKAPFTTGSFGWQGAQRFEMVVDGVVLTVQANFNIVVVGSRGGKAPPGKVIQ